MITSGGGGVRQHKYKGTIDTDEIRDQPQLSVASATEYVLGVFVRTTALRPSISRALLYMRTPPMTTAVPRAERGVTALANRITESQMSSARFAVFATLRYDDEKMWRRSLIIKDYKFIIMVHIDGLKHAQLHAIWFIRETVKLRLDPILGSISNYLMVKFH